MPLKGGMISEKVDGLKKIFQKAIFNYSILYRALVICKLYIIFLLTALLNLQLLKTSFGENTNYLMHFHHFNNDTKCCKLHFRAKF